MKKYLKQLKQATAFILVLALTVTSINMSAFADIITGPVIYNSSSFDTIEEALSKAKDNGDKTPTIYLKSDVDLYESITLEEDEKVTIGSYTDNKVTIHLTGNTTSNTSFTVNEDCSLTFHNVDIQGNWTETENCDGNISYSKAYVLKVSPFVVRGNMVLNNATVKNYYVGKPVITLDNGNLDMVGESGIKHVYLGISGTLISSTGVSGISGGTITGMDGYIFGYPAAIESKNEDSELTLDSITFDNNLSGFVDAYRLIMKDCTVSNNDDVDHYVSATYGYLNGCIFENNRSYYNGTVTITYGEIFNSEFTKQRATTGTACVYLSDANVTLGGNYFHDNSLRSVRVKNSKADFVSGTVNSDVLGDDLQVVSSTFDTNSEYSIYAESGAEVVIDQAAFRNNSASAIYVESGAEVIVSQANFIDNSTSTGAAIYNNGSVSLYNAVFSGNTATGKNTNNTNTVTKGDAVYNNGILCLYSAVNFCDNNIYECDESQLIVKEDLA